MIINASIYSFFNNHFFIVFSPRILTQDGHLIFQTGANYNISFRTSGRGSYINIDGEDIKAMAQQVGVNDLTREKGKEPLLMSCIFSTF